MTTFWDLAHRGLDAIAYCLAAQWLTLWGWTWYRDHKMAQLRARGARRRLGAAPEDL